MATTRNPIVKVALDNKIMTLCGALISRLELVGYDPARRGVFKTAWARALFEECVASQMETDRFNVDEWYANIAGGTADRRVNPALYTQTIHTDWLSPLFSMETKCEGFIILLYNVMEMEATAHDRLATSAKREAQYDFLSANNRTMAMLECNPNAKKNIL